jgi:Tautomerase enzyme
MFVIKVTMRRGRTAEQKAELIHRLTDAPAVIHSARLLFRVCLDCGVCFVSTALDASFCIDHRL